MATRRRKATATPKKEGTQGEGFYEFNGTMELFDAIKDTPAGNHSRGYMSKHFCPYSWEEATEGLIRGWREGVGEIHAITSKIQSMEGIQAGGAAIDFDVTGDFIDMGQYMEGVPECMGHLVPNEIVKDEVTILVSASIAGGVDSKTIHTRGAVITALIEKLMETHHVNLLFGFRSHKHAGARDIEMTLKVDLQNEFSRDVIAFCSAHSGFLRRCLFSLMEKDAGSPSCQGEGYGSVSECNKAIEALNKAGIKHYYFGKVTGGDHPEWETPEAALVEVNRIIESLK
jgi:hypothetical protein